MSCRRAFEIDLLAYLAEPREAEFADFRDHYPRCADCSAELAAWTELDARLHGGGAHPEVEEIAAFAQAPNEMDASARGLLEAHVRGCASCRDELHGLRAFDARGFAAAPAEEIRPEAPSLGVRLRRLLWHPAFAYGLLLLVAAPTVFWLLRPLEESGSLAPTAVFSDHAPAEAEDRAAAQEMIEGKPKVAGKAAPAPAPATVVQRRERADALSESAPEAESAPALESAARMKSAAEPAPAAEGPHGAMAMRGAGGLMAADSAALRENLAAANELTLTRGARPTIGLRNLPDAGLRLGVPADGRSGRLDLRVIAPDGRERREQPAVDADAAWLVLPRDWLVPGVYRVERSGDLPPLEFAVR